MKLVALLALIASACSSPPEVDEVQQALEIGNPFASVSQNIAVGRWGTTNGVLFQRNDNLACFWSPITAIDANGVINSITVTVLGADQNDYMEIAYGMHGMYCAVLNGATYGASITLLAPSENSGTSIVLDGREAPAGTYNTFTCSNGTAFAGHNATATIGASKQYAVGYPCTLNGGSNSDYFYAQAPDNTQVGVSGGAGNDCVTWNGPLNVQPAGAMGTNTAAGDSARGWSSTISGIEKVNVPPYNCGF